MPLIKSKSKKAFEENFEKEEHAGKPKAQALAIAYSVKRRAHKAHDGKVHSDLDHGQKRGPEGYPRYQEQAQNEKGIHTPVSGVTDFPGGKGQSEAGELSSELYAGKPHREVRDYGKEKHREKLEEIRNFPKPKLEGLAEGGEVGKKERALHAFRGDHEHSMHPHHKMAEGGQLTHDGYQSPHPGHTIHIHVNPQGEYGPHRGEYAEGGEIHKDHAMRGEESPDHEEDMVDRIMKKREHMYSEGGRVANKEEELAGTRPNEFDDLALDDDLSEHYSKENSGDELGSHLNQEDEDDDLVGRAMRRRAR